MTKEFDEKWSTVYVSAFKITFVNFYRLQSFKIDVQTKSPVCVELPKFEIFGIRINKAT